MAFKLDKKDSEILRVLDENFRVPFSHIAKKVKLSKNSVGLRFKRLKELMLHNTAGINNKIIGYTLVKIFYIVDSYDEEIEAKIISELKKQKNIVYAARHYGYYNLEVAMFVKDFEEFNDQIEKFNKKFSKKINEKDIEIIVEEYFFRNNFLYDKPILKYDSKIAHGEKKEITKSDKRILYYLRDNPRISILELAEKTSLNPKTAITRIKKLEKQGIITGYFMMLDYSKFNLSTFKLLIQVSNLIDENKFEEYLSSIKNTKHFSKMLGLWDYEVDLIYPSILELQKQIEEIKSTFPNQIKKIEIISHGKRIVTNKASFLL